MTALLKRVLHIALLALGLVLLFAARAEGASTLDSLLLRFDTYSKWSSPEKVYLHFDRTCYTAGETIWFKGWLQEASKFSVLPVSNFMYAEVLDSRGQAIVRVKIKRDESGFPGCIELPDDLETGEYTIRAYTLWQLNFDNEYLFNDKIRIIGASEKKKKARKEPAEGLEISFWPEGGRYFTSHKATMGFKVVDTKGRSVDFSGFLVCDTDGEKRPVSTVHDGMGTFSLLPKPGRSYSIHDSSDKIYPLPTPSEEGATLQLRIHSDQYHISSIGFGGGVASLLLRDSAELFPLADINLDGTMRTLIVEKSFFRPGINHFLLVDSHGKILAERLFFIRDEKAPVCKLEMKQFEAIMRAPAKGEISLSAPDGAPLDGNCSVSVVRGVLKNWQQSDGITSYMGLSSELKGKINNPYYYFDPDIPENERDAALDILMMIQGWRYYDLEKITDVKGGNFKIKYVRERVQEIRGRVTRPISAKIPKKFTFTFMIPGKKLVNSLDVEQGSHFIIDSLDFSENTEMLINIGTSRIGANYIPKWNGDPAADTYLYKPAPGFAKDVAQQSPQLVDPSSDYTLKAAVVTASYDEDDVLVFGRSFREDLEIFKDMTLVEYLSMRHALFEYDGENMYNRNKRRLMSSDDDLVSSGFEDDDDNDSGIVKLIVDDSEEPWWSFDMLRLEDLRSLSISTQPDPVYGGDGGVVHITMKPGYVNRREDRNPSLLYFVPLGYQTPRYFESPRYDQGESGPYDARNTLWWSPDVKLEGGRATVEFCNNDLQDYPYIIRIEGQTTDGRPFSNHCVIAP